MTALTDTQIDLLIRARNNITDRIESDEHDQHTAEIDAVLSEVPAGYDNRVDLLLGRRCAKLSPRPAGWFVNPAVTLDELADGIIAEMEARTAETATEAPQHEGMWK